MEENMKEKDEFVTALVCSEFSVFDGCEVRSTEV